MSLRLLAIIHKTVWVSAVMVEADEMTEGETKFEDLIAAPK